MKFRRCSSSNQQGAGAGPVATATTTKRTTTATTTTRNRSPHCVDGTFLLFFFLLLTFCLSCGCHALLEAEAGVADFVVATAGHGVGTRVVASTTSNIILTLGDASPCVLASRHVATGQVLWRRHVCLKQENENNDNKNNVKVSTATMDDAHVVTAATTTSGTSTLVRAWTVQEGALVWEDVVDADSGSATTAQVWATHMGSIGHRSRKKVVAYTNNQHELILRNVVNGRLLGTISSSSALSSSSSSSSGSDDNDKNDGNKESWLHVMAASSNSNEENENTLLLYAILGTLRENHQQPRVVKGSSLIFCTLALEKETGTIKMQSRVPFSPTSSDYLHDSMLVVPVIMQQQQQDWHVLALTPDRVQVVQFSLPTASKQVSQTIALSQWHPLWTSLERLEDTEEAGVIRVHGTDDRHHPAQSTMGLFRLEPSDQLWDQWYEEGDEEETEFDAIVHCPTADLVVTMPRHHHHHHDAKEKEGRPPLLEAFHLDRSSLLEEQPAAQVERMSRSERHRKFSPLRRLVVTGGESLLLLPETDDRVTGWTVLDCSQDGMSTLLTTARGTTVQLSLQKKQQAQESSSAAAAPVIHTTIEWRQEEGLSHVSSALLLDASHHSLAVLDTISEEEQLETLRQMTLSTRLQLQLQDVTSLVSKSSRTDSREHDFGFVKVAVLLSSSAHRLWGMHTTTTNKRGSIGWSMDLPLAASWHSLVHGTSSSPAAVRGTNSATHSPEVLVLSEVPSKKNAEDNAVDMVWTCLEGTTGAVHASGTMSLPSPVAQVIPLCGGGGSCHQIALLMLQDGSLSVLPDDDDGKSMAMVKEHVRASRSGMYTHVVDRQEATFYSYEIAEEEADESSTLVTRPVGRTAFSGERVVGVAYPQREEVVQSPCTVLGDDSLLLKYLNPHVAVVVTIAEKKDDSSDQQDDDGFYAALASAKSSSGKRKPKGVTQPGESAAAGTADDALSEDTPNLFVNIMDTVSGRLLYRASHSNASPDQEDVPVVVTENWIIYAFFNDKTRRTELGVFSLYEGMIDSKGLTAFSSPEQARLFSSLEARDAKPVVLAKTYAMTKVVTALGVTLTRGGISSRHVIMATGDDRLMSLNRHMLEPRRPTGEVKESEKKEGLFQYHPLINFIPQWSPSYNQTVHGVKLIVSAPAALESQSLVLAAGGPDIFFTRMSPSKGFDLLPDSFNRVLLTIVLIGLLCVLAVVRGMSRKKVVTMGWS